MRNCFLPFLLIICILYSTATQSQIQKIYLQPKSTAIEKQSQVIDSIRFIPLEIREGIRLTDYSSVGITRDYFMIVDYPGKRFLLYLKNGSFVTEVSFKNLGEGFYPDYREQYNKIVFFGTNKNYTLTRKDRVQILENWDNNRNRKYFRKYSIDLSDKTFALKREQPTKNDILGASPYYDDYYWSGKINTSESYKDSLEYELKIYKNDRLVKGFFPYNRINEPRFLYTDENIFMSRTKEPDTRMVTRPFCDTIYKIVRDSIIPVYQLVLPLENSLPRFFYNQPFKNKTERENFKRNNAMLFQQVTSYYENQRYIILGIRYLSNYETYLYQKQSKAVYKIKNIRADSSHYNLPLLSDYNVQRTSDKFYKTVKAGDLVTFFALHKRMSVPIELKNFLESNPYSTSPVIVEFKFKN